MPTDDRWIPSACGLCYNTCALKVHVVDGVVVKIEGNPESGTNRGRLCPRGVSGMMMLYDPARVNTPLKRTNPEKGLGVDPGWVAISWDEALDIVAQRLKKVREDDPRKLLFVTSVTPQDELKIGNVFCATFGSPNGWNAGAGNHCGNTGHLLGALFHGAWCKMPDTNHCNYLLNFGCSSGFGGYYAAPGMAQRMADARARGMRHVAIDPFLSQSAEKADEWIPIRPGTDAAFALAMLNLLLNEYDLYDREHLRLRTNAPYLIGPDGRYQREAESNKPLLFDEADGKIKPFDAPDVGQPALEGSYEVDGVAVRPAFTLLKEQVRSFTPERASEITTVPADTIRRIAREYGEAARIGSTIMLEGKSYPYRPAAVQFFKGAEGHRNAYRNGLAFELLVQVVGASNVPGGILGMNVCSLGYPETGAGKWIPGVGPDGLLTPGTWNTPYPPYPQKSPKIGEGIDLRSVFTTSPASSGAFPIAVKDPERFQVPYGIEFILHIGANYLMTASNPRQIAEAMKNAFQVSFSLFLDETTDLSDVVLPDASYLERLSQMPDWVGSNAPVDEWTYHIRQPVVAAANQRRPTNEVLLELVERLEMRPKFYGILNNAMGLVEPYRLDPSRRYTWEELVDRQYRSRFGDEHGVDWFKEHGLIKWPKRAEEVYWVPASKARAPVYLEWILDIGQQVEQAVRELKLDLDTSAFAALPDWQPCETYEARNTEDFFAIYYKLAMQTSSSTYNNPWLGEQSEVNPFAYRAAINTETAKRKGIADGDWVTITSSRTGDHLRLRAALTQGIHPEVVAIAGCGGHWSRRLPIASQQGRGGCFEWLMPVSFEHMDLPTLTQDQCVRVSVAPEGGAA